MTRTRRRVVTGLAAAVILAVTATGLPGAAAEPSSPAQDRPAAQARSVNPGGGLPGGNQALELFNAVVRLIEPPDESVSVPGGLGGGGGKGESAKAIADVAGTVFSVAGFISGMVFGESSDKDLKEILNDLQQIQSTLNVMQQELVSIQNSIAQLTDIVEQQFKNTDCLVSLEALTDDLKAIGAANTVNQTIITKSGKMFASSATSSTGLPDTTLGPTTADLTKLTQQIDPLLSALDGINDTLMGKAAPSAIEVCSLVPVSGLSSGLTWEDDYYSALYGVVETQYQYQVQALDLLVSAYYVQAWLAAYPNAVNQPSGSTTQVTGVTPQQLAYVCFDPSVQALVADSCVGAQTAVTNTYRAIESQLLLAGVPYVWGTDGQAGMQVSFSGSKPTPEFLWVLDLNDFQATKADGTPCPYPLSTSGNNVCGGTVGGIWDPNNSTFRDGNTWLGYTGWTPATTSAWNSLLGTAGSTNEAMLGQVMQQRGLAVPSDYVLYTGESSDLLAGPALWSEAWLLAKKQTKKTYGYVTGACLLDTQVMVSQSQWTSQPWCDQEGGGTLAYLMNTPVTSTKYGYSGLQFSWNTGLPGTNGYGDLWRTPFYTSGTIFTSTDSHHTGKDGGQYVSPQTLSGGTPAFGAPGWATGFNNGPPTGATYYVSPTPTFRWPVVPASTFTGSYRGALLKQLGHPVQTPALNPAGLPTMCGEDLDGWLAQVLPAPPPNAVQQVGDVADAPDRIAPGRVTQVLGAGATANQSGMPLRVTVDARPVRGAGLVAGSTHWRTSKHLRIKRTDKGAVRIQTRGTRPLRVTLTYSAPKTAYYYRFEESYTYRVRGSRR